MKDVWRFIATGSGRLSVMTPGTSKKQRWSVGSWAMDMPYWQSVEQPLVRDLVGSGVGSGPAVEERVAWTVAPAVVPLARTLKMHLWSVPVVVS